MSLGAVRVLFLSQEIVDDLTDSQRTLVIESLNTYNPKLEVGRILPFPSGESFGIAKSADSMRFALVAEAQGIPDHATLAPDEGACATEDGDAALYRALLYLFVSPRDFGGRNIFVTQSIFPGLCALIDGMRAAPGIAFSSHPVYFLDMATGNMPDSVRRTLKLFTAMGIGYVSVHRTDFDSAIVPRKLEELLTAAGKQRAGTPYYSVDTDKRLLTYTTTQFVPGELLSSESTSTKWMFNGSNDKFYWSEVLPAAVVAAHSGYQIDCSKVVSYLAAVREEAGGAKMSKKYYRTSALFEYIEKLSELKRYP